MRFDKLHYEHQPNAVADLVDVEFRHYDADYKYSNGGKNGYLIGTIEHGHSTSRLFQHTSRKEWPVGERYRIDYVNPDRIDVRDKCASYVTVAM